MNDPIAFFLTWHTYGTWLPGDDRGWTERGKGSQLADYILELESGALMSENSCRLSIEERNIVEEQITETCLVRGWTSHAVNCRSNHLHAVVSASEVSPTKICRDIKAWCTRCLRERSNASRTHWWAERGSYQRIFDEESLRGSLNTLLSHKTVKTEISRISTKNCKGSRDSKPEALARWNVGNTLLFQAGTFKV